MSDTKARKIRTISANRLPQLKGAHEIFVDFGHADLQWSHIEKAVLKDNGIEVTLDCSEGRGPKILAIYGRAEKVQVRKSLSEFDKALAAVPAPEKFDLDARNELSEFPNSAPNVKAAVEKKAFPHGLPQGPASILDNDLYKFSMGYAVYHLYPTIHVVYRFADRGANGKWTMEAVRMLRKLVRDMRKLRLTKEERAWCEKNLPWLPVDFWTYIEKFRFDPGQVKIWLDKDHNLQMEIRGLWKETIYWEVPLLYLTSEVYFTMIDTNWTEEGQVELMEEKARRMAEAGLLWADFATRRRRHLEAQERVVVAGKKHKNFTGTSNVYLAMKHGVKALGTMAHEWIMAHSALISLEHANHFAMHAWKDIYNGNLGTALGDTFGTDSFLRDWDGVLARLFDSVRQDSGDPYEWAENMIAHYTKLNIPWTTKALGFTDGNTVDSAIAIHKWVTAKGGKCWFGIGTHLSNDYGKQSPACNIVIKLSEVIDKFGRSIPVVKISDTPGKASGDPEAVRVALKVHFGISLDDPIHEARKGKGHHCPVPADACTCAVQHRKPATKAAA